MTRTSIFWLPMLLMPAGCAQLRSSAPPATAKSDPASMLICEMELPTGSHIPQRVCRTRELTEADRRALQEVLSKPPIQKCQRSPCED